MTIEEDNIQFSKLISSLDDMGAFTPEIMHELRDSMDMEFSEITTLIRKATLQNKRKLINTYEQPQ